MALWIEYYKVRPFHTYFSLQQQRMGCARAKINYRSEYDKSGELTK